MTGVTVKIPYQVTEHPNIHDTLGKSCLEVLDSARQATGHHQLVHDPLSIPSMALLAVNDLLIEIQAAH